MTKITIQSAVAVLTLFVGVEAFAKTTCPTLNELADLYKKNENFDLNPFTYKGVKWIKYKNSLYYQDIAGAILETETARPGYPYKNNFICTYIFTPKNPVQGEDSIQYILYHPLNNKSSIEL